MATDTKARPQDFPPRLRGRLMEVGFFELTKEQRVAMSERFKREFFRSSKGDPRLQRAILREIHPEWGAEE